MEYSVKILPAGITAMAKGNLLALLREKNLVPDMPCGGHGTCGKCKILVNGQEKLACQAEIDCDMEVVLPGKKENQIMTEGILTEAGPDTGEEGYLAAVDIGTTTMVCYLLEAGTGKEVACSAMQNPQSIYGADVVTRIREALAGNMEKLSDCVQKGVAALIWDVCKKKNVSSANIKRISVVGNPAMQQFFFRVKPDNLVQIPFLPVFRRQESIEAEKILGICPNAKLLVVPDISGYVGADTLGCMISTGMYRSDKMTLLVDIGTNGEMALGNREHIAACATAAGPALEGANICCGMRAAAGAIDHVWVENGKIRYSVIGNVAAEGICGSGIIDALAAAMKLSVLNARGKILAGEERNGTKIWSICEKVYLTQEDIRSVQLAKGAIAAGIELLAEKSGISLQKIEQVYLAGGFGNYLNLESACKIGLLPQVLQKNMNFVGNAAGSGAKIIVRDPEMSKLTERLARETEVIELAQLPEFQRKFAKCMRL